MDEEITRFQVCGIIQFVEGGAALATVTLRPVDLWRLEAAISKGSDRQRGELAHELAFGRPL